jgi:hypothetical protein
MVDLVAADHRSEEVSIDMKSNITFSVFWATFQNQHMKCEKVIIRKVAKKTA